MTSGAPRSEAHPTELVRARGKENRGERDRRPWQAYRRGPPEAEATERGGKGVRDARGVAAQLIGELTDGGEAWVSGSVIDRGGRRWSRMNARSPAANHPGGGGLGFMVV